MSLFKIKQKKNKKKLYFCGIPICTFSQDSETKQYIREKFDKLFYIVLPAQKSHPAIFAKYKNIYKGKDVVLCATGPTFNYYTPIKNAIHVGVNNAYKNDNVPLDYLFAQDGETIVEQGKDKILNYRKEKCQKFFGIHYLKPAEIETVFISEKSVEGAQAERYYFLLHTELPYSSIPICNADITTRPLNTWGSVSFCALEFILWTHPKRVYLVGCDNSFNGYFKKQDSPLNSTPKDYEIMYNGWLAIKDFIRGIYPDVEIISVNPVGLKGMFNDVYTKSYILEHPEINENNLVILKEEK